MQNICFCFCVPTGVRSSAHLYRMQTCYIISTSCGIALVLRWRAHTMLDQWSGVFCAACYSPLSYHVFFIMLVMCHWRSPAIFLRNLNPGKVSFFYFFRAGLHHVYIPSFICFCILSGIPPLYAISRAIIENVLLQDSLKPSMLIYSNNLFGSL